ncbi:glycosyltransferase family 4 protein [Patescibacteria group bacterium]
MTTIHIAFLLALCISFLTTPFVIWISNKFDLVDDPLKRPHPAHTHTHAIPRGGGLSILLGLLIPIVFLMPISKKIIGILTASILLVFIGLLDDKKDVNPYVRILTNIIAILVVIGVGIAVPYITHPFTGSILMLDGIRISFDFFGSHSIVLFADIVAFLWIMWTINIVGWSAGVDGQMPGFVAISAFVLGILSIRYSIIDPNQMYVTLLAFIVSGTYAGFLPWNFYPQKIMPGYGGKTLAGFLLGLLGILSYAKFGTALLVLGIPSVDAFYILIRRISSGKSPVWADRGHLHHKLLDIGWGRRRISLFYWILSAILGAIALTISSQQKIFTLLLVFVGVGGLIVWLNYFTQSSKRHDRGNG